MRMTLAMLWTALGVSGCGGQPLFPLASTYPWKCVMRDSRGDLFLGIEQDRQAAIEEADRQCRRGSAFKQSCKPENSYCQQLPATD